MEYNRHYHPKIQDRDGKAAYTIYLFESLLLQQASP
jgi:hypothetical protein